MPDSRPKTVQAMRIECRTHVNDYCDCAGDTYNLVTEVFTWNVDGKLYWKLYETQDGATDPLSVVSKLESPLVVTLDGERDT